MLIFFWLIIFIISLAVLLKGADWLLKSAERIGLAMGLSSFVIGATIIGIGTSLPELFSSLAAVLKGVAEIVPANAIGSNITNILLVVGISALVNKKLSVTKSLIDVDLPLLASTSALFVCVAWDRQITRFESILLLLAFVVYFVYAVIYKDDGEAKDSEATAHLTQAEKKAALLKEDSGSVDKIKPKDVVFFIIGLIFLVFGSKYLIESVIKLSEIFSVGVGVISLTAVALGTSLPELLVSVKAALAKKSEIALGNIFGSNIFNILMVVGLPGIFKELVLDEQTFYVGLPIMVLATLLFVISGISRRIQVYEGAMFLIIYLFFLGRLFGLI